MKYSFICGVPRAGSTLFSNILNQNPSFYATQTCPIPDVIQSLREQFSNNLIFKSLDREKHYYPFLNGIHQFLNGYYKGLTSKEHIFIKNRGLLNQLPLYDQIFGHKETKVIYLYRDPVEVCNSIEQAYRKTILLKNIDEDRLNYNLLDERINRYTEPGSILDRSVNYLYDAINMGYGERVFILKYGDLLNNPKQLFKLVYVFINEENFEHDLNNIQQTTIENDEIWNNKFSHKIIEGSIVKPLNNITLPPYLINKIKEKYTKLYEIVKEN